MSPPAPDAPINAVGVTFAVTISGTIADFDQDAYRTWIASQLAAQAVTSEDISLFAVAASVRVVAIISTTVSSAPAIIATLTTAISNALEPNLNVTLESVEQPRYVDMQWLMPSSPPATIPIAEKSQGSTRAGSSLTDGQVALIVCIVLLATLLVVAGAALWTKLSQRGAKRRRDAYMSTTSMQSHISSESETAESSLPGSYSVFASAASSGPPETSPNNGSTALERARAAGTSTDALARASFGDQAMPGTAGKLPPQFVGHRNSSDPAERGFWHMVDTSAQTLSDARRVSSETFAQAQSGSPRAIQAVSAAPTAPFPVPVPGLGAETQMRSGEPPTSAQSAFVQRGQALSFSRTPMNHSPAATSPHSVPGATPPDVFNRPARTPKDTQARMVAMQWLEQPEFDSPNSPEEKAALSPNSPGSRAGVDLPLLQHTDQDRV